MITIGRGGPPLIAIIAPMTSVACKPYAGVGLGVFFARASDTTGSASDNAGPGLNVLAGVRYFMTERVALVGEYKYNRATFDFDTVGATAAGLKGDYSASHIVGGLSLHF